MNHLKDIHVLVLGLGDSGLAMARWCARFGAAVRVWDSREVPPQAAALREAVPSAELITGELTDAAFDGVRLVLKSPGLAPGDARIAASLERAADTGILVQGELDLFARALADLKTERRYAPKVVAITGTNGKTTTTAMAALLIERTGVRVEIAGNIGPTMLQTLSDALDLEPVVDVVEAAGPHPDPLPVGEGEEAAADVAEMAEAVAARPHPNPLPGGEDALADAADEPEATEVVEAPAELLPLPPGEGGGEGVADTGPPILLTPPLPAAPVFEHLPDVWVLELSSFQLHEAKAFEPDAAALLNVTQDHLDWHGDMAAYMAAKARVFGQRATIVINRDDPLVEKMVPAPQPASGAAKPTKLLKGKTPKMIERNVVRFGLDAPKRPGDYGLVVEGGMAWLVRAMEADETIKRSTRRGAAVEEEEIHLQRLMPAEALRVRGRHNAANALAALALATAIGRPLAPMLHGLREYGGEPHRVEFIVSIDGVEAYDDSKGTNVGATVAALDGLGADKSPAKLVVILGGDGKGQDFSPLARPVSLHVRAVATIGRDAEAIEVALAGTAVAMQRHATLEAATRWAFTQAHAGDAVLLSPACASLDMFRNYAHRAEVFVAAVNEISADGGHA